MVSSTFDEVLGLEEQFYEEGYHQGLLDGVKAGRIEGRTFGLEQGFEKYVESGQLHGKSVIWANRVPQLRYGSTSDMVTGHVPIIQASPEQHNNQSTLPRKLPDLLDNVRLSKNIKTLHALAESESLSTANTEEAVADLDDRCKRAYAKAKIIERTVGEVRGELGAQVKTSGDGSIEDVSVLSARH